MVHGFTTLEAAGGFGIPLELDESFRRWSRPLFEEWSKMGTAREGFPAWGEVVYCSQESIFPFTESSTEPLNLKRTFERILPCKNSPSTAIGVSGWATHRDGPHRARRDLASGDLPHDWSIELDRDPKRAKRRFGGLFPNGPRVLS